MIGFLRLFAFIVIAFLGLQFVIGPSEALREPAANVSPATVAVTETGRAYPVVSPNGCVTFTVGPGTGCAWMCNYCANALGTSNYYFPDGVCQYSQGGCVGNPVAGKQYTCCAAGAVHDEL
jgi:hypothetical protein